VDTRQVAGLAFGLGLGLLARPATAQISPGELSQGHAKLEGSQNCLKCHDPAKGVSNEKCLACHDVLKRRVDAGLGLHARPEYRDCAKCHVEHSGRTAALVWWGDIGREAFDHSLTGYALAGRHVSVACEACHLPKLGDTFLGLRRDCAACHPDVHRGQFARRVDAGRCDSCHTQTAWRPASGFDHSKTAYPLTGLHATVACTKCHQAVGGASQAAEALKFKGIPYQSCASCHQDPHAGRLGTSCASCHTTAGWRKTERKSFDHDRTAYPLRGRHSSVPCDKCHRPGKALRVAHERCADCHADIHRGQFARRPDGGRCESCHDVQGFSPARYTTDDHQKSSYPLAGAHMAVPCDACHRRDAERVMRFRLASKRCADCHEDPHHGEMERYAKKGGCEACHEVGSWRSVAFDHGATRFALLGRHAKLACGKCHEKLDAGTPRERVRLTGLPLTCTGCHKDPHAAQFADATGAVTCERCHTADSWKSLLFVHDRDSSYRLEGAHARTPCASCHKTEMQGGAAFVRYKPLRSDCKDCHGGVRPERSP
jgi:hypothetical protein